jgi:hypothetical protein
MTRGHAVTNGARYRRNGARVAILVAGLALLASACSVPTTKPAQPAPQAPVAQDASCLNSCSWRKATTTTTKPVTTTAPATTTTTKPATVTTTAPAASSPLQSAGTRDARSWPFAVNSAWNTPLGSGATFDSRNIVPGPFNISSANGYGVCVGGAGYALNTSCNSGEGHYSLYRTDGVTVDEYYAYNSTSGAYKNHMVTDARGSGVGVGWDTATQISQLAGTIRLSDLQKGVIPHTLQIALAATVLSKVSVWPAMGVDGYAGSNTGWVPYGALLAIPANAPMPTGMSAVGQMIWTALRNYGAYVADCQGPVGSGTQNFTGLRAEAAAAAAIAPAGPDMAKIGAQLRWVTNNTTDNGATNLGGPGTRLAPLAPPLA